MFNSGILSPHWCVTLFRGPKRNARFSLIHVFFLKFQEMIVQIQILIFLFAIVIFASFTVAGGKMGRIARIFRSEEYGEEFKNYLIARSNLKDHGPKKYAELLKQFHSFTSSSDDKIYAFLRANAVVKPDGASHGPKLKKLMKIGIRGKKILDIGTEEISYLNDLEALGAMAFGINIRSEFGHYSNFDESDKRFLYYDGINIPFENESFDVVTIFSVIHHIPPQKLQPLLVNIFRVLKRDGIVFVKENDLSEKIVGQMFDIQHEIYEGAIFPGKPFYRNSKQKISEIIREFERAGMTLVEEEKIENFTRISYLIFRK